jgi:hypothetical protein
MKKGPGGRVTFNSCNSPVLQNVFYLFCLSDHMHSALAIVPGSLIYLSLFYPPSTYLSPPSFLRASSLSPSTCLSSPFLLPFSPLSLLTVSLSCLSSLSLLGERNYITLKTIKSYGCGLAKRSACLPAKYFPSSNPG